MSTIHQNTNHNNDNNIINITNQNEYSNIDNLLSNIKITQSKLFENLKKIKKQEE